jgi:hypothetical protein
MPSHVANAGNAVREEEWEGEVGIPNVHVHVPEPGNEELPSRRNDLCTGRSSDVIGEFFDVAGMDEHVNVLARRRTSYANDSDILQEQIGRLGRRERGREQECESGNEPHEEYWTPQNGDLFPLVGGGLSADRKLPHYPAAGSGRAALVRGLSECGRCLRFLAED